MELVPQPRPGKTSLPANLSYIFWQNGRVHGYKESSRNLKYVANTSPSVEVQERQQTDKGSLQKSGGGVAGPNRRLKKRTGTR